VLAAAAAAFASASSECRIAELAADAAYQRLEGNPESLEYQGACSDARKREAAAALRKREAHAAYLAAGGYASQDPHEGEEASSSARRAMRCDGGMVKAKR
jgi:hypothetical protein